MIKTSERSEDAVERHLISSRISGMLDAYKPYFQVTYTQPVAGKMVLACIYLQDKNTGRKYVLGTGQSVLFFEEDFSLALGEKYAYEEALATTKQALMNYASLDIFLKANQPSQEFIANRFVLTGESFHE